MNERIKELAGQAEMAANKGDHVDVKIMMEKFAELIVRECLLKIENERFELPDFIIDSVKKHFGVDRARGEQ